MVDLLLGAINERVAKGILNKEDSIYLLDKVAKLEIELMEARGVKLVPGESIVINPDPKTK